LNPRSPPSPDTDYVSSDDETYNFRAELDDITVLTASVTLEIKETVVSSLLHNGAFKDCHFEESDEEETYDNISVLSQEEPVELPEEDIMSIPYKYSVLYPKNIIKVTVFYITGCAPSFYVKNKNEVIMVETTPWIVYDAMGVYYKQGYDSMNGHAMLLQAAMDRKKKSAQKKMSALKTDFGHLAPGEMKKEHPVFKFPFEIEDVFYDVTGNHVTPKVYGGQRSKYTPPPCILLTEALEYRGQFTASTLPAHWNYAG
jgi:hypothetical protein